MRYLTTLRQPWHRLILEEGTDAQFLDCFKRLRFSFCGLCGTPLLRRYKGPLKGSCRDWHACTERINARRAELERNKPYLRYGGVMWSSTQ